MSSLLAERERETGEGLKAFSALLLVSTPFPTVAPPRYNDRITEKEGKSTENVDEQQQTGKERNKLVGLFCSALIFWPMIRKRKASNQSGVRPNKLVTTAAEIRPLLIVFTHFHFIDPLSRGTMRAS